MPTTLPFSAIKRALSQRLDDASRETTSLQDEHRLVERALEQIEAMADALPAVPPTATLEWLIDNLRDALPAHCRQEEAALDALAGAAASVGGREAVLRAKVLLADEHAVNDAVAAELAEALEECLSAGAVAHPEALGQLARQYFLLMRRHMIWEEYLMETFTLPRGPSQN